MNHKRVERIWRQEGLKVPKKQPKRGRIWLNDGSCIRLRPLYRHHVWSYDFVMDRAHDGRPLRMLTVLDEYSRECLAKVTAAMEIQFPVPKLGPRFTGHVFLDGGREWTPDDRPILEAPIQNWRRFQIHLTVGRVF